MKTAYGIQMFSLRDVTPTDMEGALRTVAALGFRSAEFAGFFNHPAAEIREMLDRFGLVCNNTHTQAALLAPDVLADTIAYHKTIGADTIIIPTADQSSEEAIAALIALINRVQPILAAEGMHLAFHNHSREFLPGVGGKLLFDRLHDYTNVEFEIDTFWAFNAGRDPLPLLEGLKKEGRIRVIHLKDGICQKGETKAIGMSLGSGEAPVKAVRAKALELELGMVVESEGLQPNGPEEVGRCAAFLSSLEK